MQIRRRFLNQFDYGWFASNLAFRLLNVKNSTSAIMQSTGSKIGVKPRRPTARMNALNRWAHWLWPTCKDVGIETKLCPTKEDSKDLYSKDRETLPLYLFPIYLMKRRKRKSKKEWLSCAQYTKAYAGGTREVPSFVESSHLWNHRRGVHRLKTISCWVFSLDVSFRLTYISCWHTDNNYPVVFYRVLSIVVLLLLVALDEA